MTIVIVSNAEKAAHLPIFTALAFLNTGYPQRLSDIMTSRR
jgi:hypothetical protein